MRFTLAGRKFEIRWGKVILWLFVLLIAAGLAAFVRQTYIYYHAIKSGETDPMLQLQLKSSASRFAANDTVTPEDLARLASSEAPALGKAGVPVTLVVFVDYGCPFSKISAQPLRQLAARYPDTLRVIVRDFPITELHPRAMADAIAARCAQAQGRFWPYFDLLFAHQDQQEEADLAAYASAAGLDTAAFKTCYDAQTPQSKIYQDMQDGLDAGVEGTPTFFFNGHKVQGGMDDKTLDYVTKLFMAQAKK